VLLPFELRLIRRLRDFRSLHQDDTLHIFVGTDREHIYQLQTIADVEPHLSETLVPLTDTHPVDK